VRKTVEKVRVRRAVNPKRSKVQPTLFPTDKLDEPASLASEPQVCPYSGAGILLGTSQGAYATPATRDSKDET